MLAEYGLIPDIFDPATYSSAEVCGLRLASLKRALLEHGLVRDFRAGEWRAYVRDRTNGWDPRAKELVKKLVTQNRLVLAPPAGPGTPTTDSEWCEEALASHRVDPLTGIIAASTTAQRYTHDKDVSPIERLDGVPWWAKDRQAVRLKRNTAEYLQHLELVLKHSHFLMFLDPHLDPSRNSYAEFVKLLLAAKRQPGTTPVQIQIHRACYDWRTHKVQPERHWRNAFSMLNEPLAQAVLEAEVFVWDEMHDRFLISNLIGIQMGNGFDVAQKNPLPTTWTRLNREVRESLQREFDHPNNIFHELHAKFAIGQVPE